FLVSRIHQKLETGNWKLYPAALRRTAPVVRNRRGVLDIAHFNAGGAQSANRGLASRARAANPHFHAAHAVVPRQVRCVHGCLLRGEGSAFPRSAKPQRTRTLPRE